MGYAIASFRLLMQHAVRRVKRYECSFLFRKKIWVDFNELLIKHTTHWKVKLTPIINPTFSGGSLHPTGTVIIIKTLRRDKGGKYFQMRQRAYLRMGCFRWSLQLAAPRALMTGICWQMFWRLSPAADKCLGISRRTTPFVCGGPLMDRH